MTLTKEIVERLPLPFSFFTTPIASNISMLPCNIMNVHRLTVAHYQILSKEFMSAKGTQKNKNRILSDPVHFLPLCLEIHITTTALIK